MMQVDEQCGNRLIHLERVEKARQNGLSQKDTDHLTDLFKVMGDASRLKILWALLDGEMCVCDLAAYVGVSESAVSHQLRQLRHLHLVTNRRQGVVLYYRLNDEHVSELIHLALEHIHEE